ETLFFQKSNIFMADFSLSTSSGWNFDLQGGICFFIRPRQNYGAPPHTPQGGCPLDPLLIFLFSSAG
ncbi:MAG: hypothetical protein LBE65_06695, partial [Synergistaceae bacterium]|nr:hypothetical protein [Synergistaceae bacterium]